MLLLLYFLLTEPQPQISKQTEEKGWEEKMKKVTDAAGVEITRKSSSCELWYSAWKKDARSKDR